MARQSRTTQLLTERINVQRAKVTERQQEVAAAELVLKELVSVRDAFAAAEAKHRKTKAKSPKVDVVGTGGG